MQRILQFVQRVVRGIRARSYLITGRHPEDPFYFLRHVRGVIHIGANVGQERDIYAKHRLKVVWIEPISEVFVELKTNISGHAEQTAIQALITEQDDISVPFHVADNTGESSSILEFGLHTELWPEIQYRETRVIQSVTLPTLLARNGLDIAGYDALVLDTQGAEMQVLRGAEALLPHFQYILTEAPDFEAYIGCCTVSDLQTYLQPLGFSECFRRRFAQKEEVGDYYDLLFERRQTP